MQEKCGGDFHPLPQRAGGKLPLMAGGPEKEAIPWAARSSSGHVWREVTWLPTEQMAEAGLL